MSLLLNILSRFIITFLPRSKRLLISWLQSPSAVILEPIKIKSDTVSTVSPSISHEVIGPDAMILVFWMLKFKPTFWLSSYTFIKRLFSSASLSAIRVVSPAYLRLLILLLSKRSASFKISCVNYPSIEMIKIFPEASCLKTGTLWESIFWQTVPGKCSHRNETYIHYWYYV